MIEIEHNPSTCSICQEMGDYSQQKDVFGHDWLAKHHGAGRNITIKIGFGLPGGVYTFVVENLPT